MLVFLTADIFIQEKGSWNILYFLSNTDLKRTVVDEFQNGGLATLTGNLRPWKCGIFSTKKKFAEKLSIILIFTYFFIFLFTLMALQITTVNA